MADYVARQGVAPFAAAADRYLAVLQKLFDAWRAELSDEQSHPDNVASAASEEKIYHAPPPDLSDLDRAVADYCQRRGISEPHDIEERMNLHLAAITEWLGSSGTGE
jgi:hypothetical protein